MKSDTVYHVIIPIAAALITGAATYFATSGFYVQSNAEQEAEMGMQISNVLNASSIEIGSVNDLQDAMDALIGEYQTELEENEQSSQEIVNLQKSMEELQLTNADLNTENAEIKAENEKIKDFLMKDGVYIDQIDELLEVEVTTDRLEDLILVDSEGYKVVDGFKDLYGDSHSVSYRLWTAGGTASVTYILAGQYDIFQANIGTNQETAPDVLMSVEVYVDGVLMKRVDNISKISNLVELGPISVRDAELLQIKAICIEGYSYDGYCYITDDSLSRI